MELAVGCSYRTRSSSLLNSLFTSTVNSAAKMLAEVASGVRSDGGERWSAGHHLRFAVMLFTWSALWFLRFLMDYLPSPFSDSPPYAALPSSPNLSSSLDVVILHEGLNSTTTPSMEALGRALSHILKMINEIPASSRKYQFAVAMAERIIDENTKSGYAEFAELNRGALASAFERTTNLLYHALQRRVGASFQDRVSWTRRLLQTVPLGSYVSAYFKGISFVLNLVFSPAKEPVRERDEDDDDLAAEKHAQELMWIAGKLKSCDAVDEALVQWSLASRLASLSLVANPRVQALILRITVTLFRELGGAEWEVGSDVKFRMMGLWIPLLCYAGSGLAYPVLTGYEKVEIERILDDVVLSLPASYQEIVLANWMQDFAMSASDWPNLQASYDRWCRSSRRLLEWSA